MLEQTLLHGPLYISHVKGKTLVSKPVNIPDVKFGPMRSITIYKQLPDVLVVDNHTQEQYVYTHGTLVTPTTAPTPTGSGFTYFYGMAQYKDSDQPYFIQNQPVVSIPNIPDVNTFVLPQTLQPLDYDCVFTYPQELIQVLQDVPATYVDRYKRPIIQKEGRIYPVAMTSIKTTLQDMPPSTYPIVIDLSKTNFAMVDLEPNYTEGDLAHFEALQGYYQEDTPRGGKHLLVCLDSDVSKFRYSPQLEIINESIVSIYGINAVWINDSPPPIRTTEYASTAKKVVESNHTKIALCDTQQQEQVEQYTQMLTQSHTDNHTSSKERAIRQYRQDSDTSHGEYIVLYTLWYQDVKHYQKQLSQELLPWILQAYANDCIPWREKHETRRNGVPYLIYLCHQIIAWDNKKK